MLHEFLTTHRADIIARTRERVAERQAPRATPAELEHGVPLFLSQLGEALRREQETTSRPTAPEIGAGAALYGSALRKAGFTISQVVHDYGDICQVVMELALEMELEVSADEFKTLNRSLDEAIAEAVTEFTRQRDASLTDVHSEHLGVFAHELRNLLGNALLAFEVLKSGTVGVGGSTGAILSRNLLALRDLIDRSLAEVRLEKGVNRVERIALSAVLEEVQLAAAIAARARHLELDMPHGDGQALLDVDRQLVAAALANLLQNAFKFTRANGRVTVRTATLADRVVIEVEDECGGLPPGQAEDLFRPFEQRGGDRSGMGLGLTIARRSIKANGGQVRLRDLPGRGCVFSIELPLAGGLPLDGAVAAADVRAAGL